MNSCGYTVNRYEYEPFRLNVWQAETACLWMSCGVKYDTSLHFLGERKEYTLSEKKEGRKGGSTGGWKGKKRKGRREERRKRKRGKKGENTFF